MIDDTDEFFAELNADIAKLTAKSDLEAKQEKARKATNNHHSPPSARAQARADLAETTEQLEVMRWKSEANVALFSTQACDGCASVHSMFVAFMIRQSTVSGSKVSRLQRTIRPELGLPNEVLKQQFHSHMCVDCASDFGFFPNDGRLQDMGKGEPYMPSKGYEAEELN